MQMDEPDDEMVDPQADHKMMDMSDMTPQTKKMMKMAPYSILPQTPAVGTRPECDMNDCQNTLCMTEYIDHISDNFFRDEV